MFDPKPREGSANIKSPHHLEMILEDPSLGRHPRLTGTTVHPNQHPAFRAPELEELRGRSLLLVPVLSQSLSNNRASEKTSTQINHQRDFKTPPNVRKITIKDKPQLKNNNSLFPSGSTLSLFCHICVDYFDTDILKAPTL
ncbi:hypothetical protein NPIL_424441 [Nephila pilipes]|uniref:Uncharacterized protein n=1 Tax=Nephila pilipes TaxID=299642 RepID=A0A8X6MXE9_NEPPI|nr:hypothetical protein NPIL_424441 [Nephila pilipes]